MIRKAETKDIGRIEDLLLQVNHVHAAGRPDIFIDGKMKYSREEIEKILSNPETPVFVWVDENDRTEGYAFCIVEITKNLSNLRDKKTLYVDDICVEEKMRRRHIATDLYEFVKKYAAENGFDRITLNVWELNPGAKAFYEKMGMKPLKTVMETIL